ncbi:MAG: AAA family ATPase [Clostridioides sp.]|jgi:lon-related putative ATP-dependent protease|nr:AAA family ATPase [Clostridioides sp.]
MIEYNNTSQLKSSKKIICQKDVREAFEFGLNIDNPFYNIYVAGETGLGKTDFVKNILNNKKYNNKKAKDWCYVNNFDNQKEPILISFDIGEGKQFKEGMENLLKDIFDTLRDFFDSNEYENEKDTIFAEYQLKKQRILKALEIYGRKLGFLLKKTSKGYILVPEDCEECAENIDDDMNCEEKEFSNQNKSNDTSDCNSKSKTTYSNGTSDCNSNSMSRKYDCKKCREAIIDLSDDMLISDDEEIKNKNDVETKKEKKAFKKERKSIIDKATEISNIPKENCQNESKIIEKQNEKLDNENESKINEKLENESNIEDELSYSDKIIKNKILMEQIVAEVGKKISKIQNDYEKKLLEFDITAAKVIVDPMIENICKLYTKNCAAVEFLKQFGEEIIDDIEIILYDEDSESEERTLILKKYFKKFEVNLFVDNSNLLLKKNKVPVIIEQNPTVANLFGKAEYTVEGEHLKTSFNKLVSGSMHKANGGYLILYADQIFRNATSWEYIKKTLRTQEIDLDTQTSLAPQPMKFDTKIIIIGRKAIFDKLYEVEDEFRKFFNVLVDFRDCVDKNEENKYKYARYIAMACRKYKLKHLEKKAVDEVMRYCSRIKGDREKLSTKVENVDQILIEANEVARISSKNYITREDVKKALYKKIKRLSKVEKILDESVVNNSTLIDVENSRVGVINGLCVLQNGEYSFGRVIRITATTSPGNKGIINIEREADMSGAVHNKGMLILGGYLSEKFAQDFVMSLNAYICIEQNYGGIEGDSASSSELYALLSSLSGLPIKQNIAVTGSINQKGDVQVVGGVNEKIEGFYNVCKLKNKTDGIEVIIPKRNSRNLVLCDEVQRAIKEKKLIIHEVSRVEEAFEILTGEKFEKASKLIEEKLLKFSNLTKS